jgi:putative FmdB family regulatory protein
MPVYEYVCNACGKEFEYQQRMADPDKTVCEACGKEALERIISRTAFQLKGGGWYKDLYSSSKPEAKSDSTTKADAPKSSDSAAAPTPAAATPAAAPAASGSSGGSTSGSSSGGSSSGGSSSGGSSSGGGGTAAS